MVETDVTRFDFSRFGEYLGTRQLGERVHKELVKAIGAHRKVALDFTGVKVVANSFADECIGKLLLTMTLDELKSRTTFVGLNDLAKQHIVVALRWRLAAACTV